MVILTFYVSDAINPNQGVEWADILSWTILWNGTDVSDDIIPIGGGMYKISVGPITISPGGDPILLNMTISAVGYEQRELEFLILVDPEIINKKPELGTLPPSGGGEDGNAKKAEEFGIPIIILVVVGVGSAIGASAITIFILRKRILLKRKI